MIEKINIETLETKEKEKTKVLRVYPEGTTTLSSGVAEQLGLKEGDRIEFFTEKDEFLEKMFISKSSSEKGFILKNQKDGGLRIHNINLSKMIIGFFKIEEDERSLAMRVYPEPHKFKEYNGYVAYQIIKK